jgi:TRAP-type mannitol/chloroaromatic compound transport system permease small subunit
MISVIRLLESIEAGCASLGRVIGWTVPILTLSVCIGVAMVQARTNVLLDWGVPVPLFGERLTLNGLNDLQWHLFALLVMLGGVYALHADAHVSVDFLAGSFSDRLRRIVTIFGDLFFLLPFAAVMTWFAWRYMAAAFDSGESSSYGGLVDRWIIKAVMPLGFGLLGLLGVTRALRLILSFFLPSRREA